MNLEFLNSILFVRCIVERTGFPGCKISSCWTFRVSLFCTKNVRQQFTTTLFLNTYPAVPFLRVRWRWTTGSSPADTVRTTWWCRGSWRVSPARWYYPSWCLEATNTDCPSDCLCPTPEWASFNIVWNITISKGVCTLSDSDAYLASDSDKDSMWITVILSELDILSELESGSLNAP